MTIKRNGFKVSGRFPAKRSVGTCPECSEGFLAGQPTVFLMARMGETGEAGGALTAAQRRDYALLLRNAQGIATARGILPRMTRYGRLARTQRAASLREVGTAPAWLFDHMVHFACLPTFAGGVAIRDITGHVGTRSTGGAHGVALTAGLGQASAPSVSPAAPSVASLGAGSVEVEAATTTETVNAEVMTAQERAAQAQALPGWAVSMAARPENRQAAETAREERQRASIERGRAQLAAQDKAAAAEVALATVALEDAGAARMRLVVEAAWDDTPAEALEYAGVDASVERFKLLDLD